MSNLSKLKRERMLAFLRKLREEQGDDHIVAGISEIEAELSNTKYGLVWEQHSERVDIEMETKIPVFTEVTERRICRDDGLPFNFLLEGDNLHSLRLLEKTHRNSIDVIYIDPPYNTGKNDFIYDDNYVDVEDGYRHSKWLSFMSVRLKIAHRLLSKDGVIFISIDDNEVAQLKLLCDSIFDERNFLGIIIQNKLNSKSDTINIQKNHEYILVYRKQCNYIDGTKEKPTLLNPVVRPRQVTQEGDRFFYLGDQITTRGEGGVLNNRPNLGYTIYYNPETGDKKAICDYDVELAKTSNDEEEVYSTNEELISQGYVAIRPPRVRGKLGAWTWELEKFERDKDQIYIYRNRNKKSSNRYLVKKRTFVDEKDVVRIGDKLVFYEYTEGNSRSIVEFSTNDGSKALTEVMGESGTFDNPKNLEMIKYLLRLFPNKNALVLDFFAGSGTTGQAVLELNETDGGRRRFILCTNNQNRIAENVTYKRLYNVIHGYAYRGKKETVIFEKQLTLDDLYHMDEIIALVEELERSKKDEFTSVTRRFSDGVLRVVGEDVIDGRFEGIPANLMYYRTGFVEKDQSDDGDVRSGLLDHITEMIQLQYGVLVDNSAYRILLTDDDADELEGCKDLLRDCKRIFISSRVLLTRSQQALLSSLGIELVPIPEYYFDNELREVGEL